jgi:hypothetical protein
MPARLARLALMLSHTQLMLMAFVGQHRLITAEAVACLARMQLRSAYERLRELRRLALL